jgi:hypothetical protein
MPEEVEAWDEEKYFTMYGMLVHYLEKTASVKFES